MRKSDGHSHVPPQARWPGHPFAPLAADLENMWALKSVVLRMQGRF